MEPINLTQLRDHANLRSDFEKYDPQIPIHTSTLLALIDIAEAAREYANNPNAWGYNYDVQAIHRLREALNRTT